MREEYYISSTTKHRLSADVDRKQKDIISISLKSACGYYLPNFWTTTANRTCEKWNFNVKLSIPFSGNTGNKSQMYVNANKSGFHLIYYFLVYSLWLSQNTDDSQIPTVLNYCNCSLTNLPKTRNNLQYAIPRVFTWEEEEVHRKKLKTSKT